MCHDWEEVSVGMLNVNGRGCMRISNTGLLNKMEIWKLDLNLALSDGTFLGKLAACEIMQFVPHIS